VSLNLNQQLTQYQHVQQQLNLNIAQTAVNAVNIVPGQLPQQVNIASQAQVNIRDLNRRKMELDTQLSKCYLKLGKWKYDLEGFNEDSTIEQIIHYYDLAKDHNRDSYKSWQAWAYANYEAIHHFKNNYDKRLNYVIQAIKGFFSCIRLSSAVDQEANCLQDTLR
jgi:hypothetical protein